MAERPGAVHAQAVVAGRVSLKAGLQQLPIDVSNSAE